MGEIHDADTSAYLSLHYSLEQDINIYKPLMHEYANYTFKIIIDFDSYQKLVYIIFLI